MVALEETIVELGFANPKDAKYALSILESKKPTPKESMTLLPIDTGAIAAYMDEKSAAKTDYRPEDKDCCIMSSISYNLFRIR